MSSSKPSVTSRKAKLYNSRKIRTDLRDPSYKEGKLSVPDFLSAREYEIKSFELSQLNSKYATSNRCFQSLPRTLRRRTASHNIKRIPKRLRAKALREMQNTVTGVPAKKKHSRGRQLYRLKMKKKLLMLASRIKSMRGLPESQAFNLDLKLRDKLKLLNNQIKQLQTDKEHIQLNNSLGSYDNTGVNDFAPKPKGNLKYSKRQKDFVWIPTHIWHAKRFHMIKKWGYQIPLSPTQKCFRSVSRLSRNGSVLFESSYYDCMTVEFGKDSDKELFFKHITHLKSIQDKLSKGIVSYEGWIYMNETKIGKGLVYTLDKTDQLLIRVHPSLFEELFIYVKGLAIFESPFTVYDCRYSIGSIEVSGPRAVHTISKVLHLTDTPKDIHEKWFKATKIHDTNVIPPGTTFAFHTQDPRIYKSPVQVPFKEEFDKTDFVIDISTNGSVDHSALTSLLDRNGRYHSYEGQLSTKDLGKEFRRALVARSKSKVPIMITKLRDTHNWCIICPWFWTQPIWLKLCQNRHISLGGLKQQHQLAFERGKGFYPTDFPFLKEGWLENKFINKCNQDLYNRKQRSKRPNYVKSEGHVSPFSCDWEFLQKLFYVTRHANAAELQKINNYGSYDENLVRSLVSVNDAMALVLLLKPTEGIPIELGRKEHLRAQTSFANRTSVHGTLPRLLVRQVSVVVTGKGSISDFARIYKVPEEQDNTEGSSSSKEPDITDLIGFVTSGTFNITAGTASGIGCVAANFASNSVLIRNVGCSSFWKARIAPI